MGPGMAIGTEAFTKAVRCNHPGVRVVWLTRQTPPRARHTRGRIAHGLSFDSLAIQGACQGPQQTGTAWTRVRWTPLGRRACCPASAHLLGGFVEHFFG